MLLRGSSRVWGNSRMTTSMRKQKKPAESEILKKKKKVHNSVKDVDLSCGLL